MNIALLAGARPNFIKAAPLFNALRACPGCQVRLIHTGQHSDPAMSMRFLEDLGLPAPDIILTGKGKTTVQETARIMLGLEPVFKQLRPDWVLVIGDVTSTLAGALAAKQGGCRLAHVEAGLRSGDRSMPEEINRIATDHMADLLFASEPAAVDNLLQEGIAAERIHFSGNVLIDALHMALPEARKADAGFLLKYSTPYVLFTFHRPSNVDDPAGLRRLVELTKKVSAVMPVIFPIHPRTVKNLAEAKYLTTLKNLSRLSLLPPQRYVEIVRLILHATAVVTDSGGIQEECTALGIPCLTFRSSTERPATLTPGSNTLIADLEPDTVLLYLKKILDGQYKTSGLPPLWDGRAAERIAAVLTQYLGPF